ncbi:hypothetical protein GCM10029976_091120 [Kribbella albertanoniae]|uniref:Uncharacterized protein n=1 Tax=Kribbella albertanoniae TaxID=1266829 RepID=A0A4R4PKJ0_9ACTN|nr:hypothetical protein [Kribbella albertanoniae]TDC22449.1 hypothetical protein E1261_30865 [Kribbella albertanoniae]
MDVKWADRDDAASWAAGKSKGVLKCRLTQSHWWDGWAARPLTEEPKVRGYNGITRKTEWRHLLLQTARCVRCKKVYCDFTIHPFTGEAIQRSAPRYEEGYLMDPGTGRLGADSKGALRLMVLAVEEERPQLRRVV